MAEPRWLDDEQMRVWRSFLTATTLLFDQIDTDAKAFGISSSEYAVLVLLSEAPGRQLRMAQLADAICYSRSRVTHTVKRLESQGLVVRSDAQDDKRGVIAVLTDSGQQRLTEAAPSHVAGVLANFLDLVARKDLPALQRAFDAVADHLSPGHPDSGLMRDGSGR